MALSHARVGRRLSSSVASRAIRSASRTSPTTRHTFHRTAMIRFVSVFFGGSELANHCEKNKQITPRVPRQRAQLSSQAPFRRQFAPPPSARARAPPERPGKPKEPQSRKPRATQPQSRKPRATKPRAQSWPHRHSPHSHTACLGQPAAGFWGLAGFCFETAPCGAGCARSWPSEGPGGRSGKR